MFLKDKTWSKLSDSSTDTSWWNAEFSKELTQAETNLCKSGVVYAKLLNFQVPLWKQKSGHGDEPVVWVRPSVLSLSVFKCVPLQLRSAGSDVGSVRYLCWNEFRFMSPLSIRKHSVCARGPFRPQPSCSSVLVFIILLQQPKCNPFIVHREIAVRWPIKPPGDKA